MIPEREILFEVNTPLGFSVRTTAAYWKQITGKKHQDMVEKIEEVMMTLQVPDRIMFSVKDDSVYLFYRQLVPERWICAIARKLNGTGYLITAYITNAIKKGELLWPK